MKIRTASFCALLMALAGLAVGLGIARGSPASQAQGPGFLALSGEAAQAFSLPADVRLAKRFQLSTYGLTYERYQQYFGLAQVLGGELTLLRDGDGDVTTVIGSHYPDINPTNVPRLTQSDAARTVEGDIGPAATRTIDLMIDPQGGRYFYRVESRSPASRWFHWIDAADGRVINKYDAIETGSGTGVKGDAKLCGGSRHLGRKMTAISSPSGKCHARQTSRSRNHLSVLERTGLRPDR